MGRGGGGAHQEGSHRCPRGPDTEVGQLQLEGHGPTRPTPSVDTPAQLFLIVYGHQVFLSV